MTNKADNRADFISWLCSRNCNSTEIDTYLKDIETVAKYYSKNYVIGFNIWTIDSAKLMDGIINSLTQRESKNSVLDIKGKKPSLLLYKKFLTQREESYQDWKTSSLADTLIDYKRRLESSTLYLKEKYEGNPAASLGQLIKDNPNISFTYFNNWTNKVIGKTASQYLVEKGILVEKQLDERSHSERLDEIIQILKKRYSKTKADSLAQITKDNRDISVSQINSWAQEIYGKTAKDYLIAMGIIKETIQTTESKNTTKNVNQKKTQGNTNQGLAQSLTQTIDYLSSRYSLRLAYNHFDKHKRGDLLYKARLHDKDVMWIYCIDSYNVHYISVETEPEYVYSVMNKLRGFYKTKIRKTHPCLKLFFEQYEDISESLVIICNAIEENYNKTNVPACDTITPVPQKQPSWNKYEIALLIEACQSVRALQISKSKAIKNLSRELRNIANKSGIEIDDTYRNEAGIALQFNNMLQILYGNNSNLHVSKLFGEIAELRKKHPEEFESILKEAHSLTGDGTPNHKEPLASAKDVRLISQIEKYVLSFDLSGTSYHQIKEKMQITITAAKQYVSESNNIVDIGGKLIHKDAFIDWDAGATIIKTILIKLMSKNNGYVSSSQLYEYAKVDLNMFLNDNGMNSEEAVFDIAKHLFDKEKFENVHYAFHGNTHISELNEEISSNIDVIRKYASDHGNVFVCSELVDYLKGLGISAGNINGQMKISTEPSFFYYDEGILMFADGMNIDDEWKKLLRKELNILLTDVGGHIILRDLPPLWIERLPLLPKRLPWTPLLIQSLLRCYSNELDAKTIPALEGQNFDTLHTMLVKRDSPIQTFGDVVITFLLDNHIEKRSYAAEELRKELVSADIIHGNELLWNMPKALKNDFRFIWDLSGDHVKIDI